MLAESRRNIILSSDMIVYCEASLSLIYTYVDLQCIIHN